MLYTGSERSTLVFFLMKKKFTPSCSSCLWCLSGAKAQEFEGIFLHMIIFGSFSLLCLFGAYLGATQGYLATTNASLPGDIMSVTLASSLILLDASSCSKTSA